MKRFFTAIISVLIVCMSCTAFAYKVSLQPNELMVNTKKRDTHLYVLNTNNKPLALEIKGLERVSSPNSFVYTEKKTQDLAFTPNKLILLPGQEKKVNVAYTGPAPDIERQFYVAVTQLDIGKKAMKDPFSMKVLTNYQKLLRVSSTKFRDKFKLKYKKKENEAGKVVLDVHFTNHGKSTYVERRFKGLKLKTSKGKFTIPKELFMEGDDQFAVAPNQTISVSIPWPKDIPLNARVRSVKLIKR